MIEFLTKGILRDRSRSLLPILVILLGVAISVVMFTWMKGVLNDMINANAFFQTGHVKITTRAFAKQADQIPNDLALVNVDSLLTALNKNFTDILWLPRIRFGGLLDIPDKEGNSRAQAPVMGMGVELFDPNSPEPKILNLRNALVRGSLSRRLGDMLLSDQLATRLNLKIGDAATLISSTMDGGMAIYNFRLAGTLRFGVKAMDRSAMLIDFADAQSALGMENAASEILGFFPHFLYNSRRAAKLVRIFNQKFSNPKDEFSPMMLSLEQQSGMGEYFQLVNQWLGIFIFIFIFVMGIVLWNAGLMGGIRRYGEFGVRLALGETHAHIYGTLLLESIVVGVLGTILGTALGLLISLYLQNHGLDVSGMMKNSTVLMSNVMRAQITPGSYFIGFVPGLLASVLGSAISGLAIFRRKTSQLFRELES